MSKIERFLSDPRYQALDDAGKKEKLDLFFNKYVTQDARYSPFDEEGKARVYSKFMSKYYGESEAKAPKQKTPFSGLKSELKGTMSLTQSAEAISTGVVETQTLDRRNKAYQKVMADREEALRIIDRERNLKQAIPQDRVAAGQQYIKKVKSMQGAPKYPIKSQYTAAMERLQPNNYTDPIERQVAHEIVNKEKLDKAQREYQRIAERTASATPEERKEIAKSLAAQQTLIDYYATGMTAAERAVYQAGQEGSESFRMVKALGAGSIDLASSVYQLFNPDSKFARTINAYSAGLLEQSGNPLEDAFAQVFYSMPMTLGYFMTSGILGTAGTATKAASIATKAGEVASLMHSVNINAYMTAKKYSDAISGYGSATAVPEGVFLAGSTAALVESSIEMLSDTAQAKIVLGQAKRIGRRGAEQIIKNSLRGKISGYGTRLATGMAESAITEFTEEILQGASGMIFDVMSNQREVPSLEEAFKELMYSGAVGALGGITFGLGGGIMVQSSNYQNWREVKKQAASGNDHAARLWEARSILDKSNPNGEVWKSDVQRAYDVIKSDLHAVAENRYQEDNPSIAQAMAQMYDAYAMVDMIKSPQQEAVREALHAGVQRILDQKRATELQKEYKELRNAGHTSGDGTAEGTRMSEIIEELVPLAVYAYAQNEKKKTIEAEEGRKEAGITEAALEADLTPEPEVYPAPEPETHPEPTPTPEPETETKEPTTRDYVVSLIEKAKQTLDDADIAAAKKAAAEFSVQERTDEAMELRMQANELDTEKEKVKPQPQPQQVDDVDGMTWAELKDEAKALGIKNPGQIKKDALKERIRKARQEMADKEARAAEQAKAKALTPDEAAELRAHLDPIREKMKATDDINELNRLISEARAHPLRMKKTGAYNEIERVAGDIRAKIKKINEAAEPIKTTSSKGMKVSVVQIDQRDPKESGVIPTERVGKNETVVKARPTDKAKGKKQTDTKPTVPQGVGVDTEQASGETFDIVGSPEVQAAGNKFINDTKESLKNTLEHFGDKAFDEEILRKINMSHKQGESDITTMPEARKNDIVHWALLYVLANAEARAKIPDNIDAINKEIEKYGLKLHKPKRGDAASKRVKVVGYDNNGTPGISSVLSVALLEIDTEGGERTVGAAEVKLGEQHGEGGAPVEIKKFDPTKSVTYMPEPKVDISKVPESKLEKKILSKVSGLGKEAEAKARELIREKSQFLTDNKRDIDSMSKDWVDKFTEDTIMGAIYALPPLTPDTPQSVIDTVRKLGYDILDPKPGSEPNTGLYKYADPIPGGERGRVGKVLEMGIQTPSGRVVRKAYVAPFSGKPADKAKGKKQPDTKPTVPQGVGADTKQTPVKAAEDSKDQLGATKKAFDMSLSEYTDQYIAEHKYKDKYEAMGKLSLLEKQAETQWVSELKEHSKSGAMSDKAIDSYIQKYGREALFSTFRGVYEKGLSSWQPGIDKDAHNVTLTENELKLMSYSKITNYTETVGVGKYKGKIWRTAEYEALNDRGEIHKYEVKVDNDGIAKVKDKGKAKQQIEIEDAAQYKENPEQIRAWIDQNLPNINDYLKNKIAEFMLGGKKGDKKKLDHTVLATVFTPNTRERLSEFSNLTMKLEIASMLKQIGDRVLSAEDIGKPGQGRKIKPVKMSQAEYARQMHEALSGKLDAAQIDGIIAVMDAMMQTYADEMGITIDQAYVENVHSVDNAPIPEEKPSKPLKQESSKEILEAKRQEAEVRKQYEGTDKWLKAPNGKPTKLTERQWLQVRTPNFKAWFGDWENDPKNASKVVDENGEPRVVKHGSNAKFNEFKIKQQTDAGWLGAGYYFFGNADIYASQYGENLYEVFLDIKNPYIVSDEEHSALANQDDKKFSAEFSQNLIDDGYDGAIFDGDLNYEIVAYSSNQIKSATGNMGTYSQETANIFKQPGAISLDGIVQGYIEKRKDGTHHIGFLDPDVSTGLHEQAHLGRELLAKLAEKSPEWRRLYDAAEEWCGVENGVWTTEAEEKFARGFEKYVYEGHAPNAKLKTLYSRLKEWMRAIIDKLKELADIKLDKNILDVYDALFGGGIKKGVENKKLHVKNAFTVEQMKSTDPHKLTAALDKVGDNFGCIVDTKGLGSRASILMTDLETGKVIVSISRVADGYEVNGYHAANNGEAISRANDILGNVLRQEKQQTSPDIAEARRQMEEVRKQYEKPIAIDTVLKMAEEEFKTNPPEGFKYVRDLGESIARVETDNTIVLTEAFFGHSQKDRKEILYHEMAHRDTRELIKDHKKFWELVESGWFGHFDKEAMKWKGKFGGRNADEDITEAVAQYRMNPSAFESKHGKEMTDAVKELSGDFKTGYMKAPNGKPTKLTERQWLQVRTPNFKAWFGDWENDPKNASKVVDENGEPLVVYHGTEYGGHHTFDTTLIFFSDSLSEATTYVDPFRGGGMYEWYDGKDVTTEKWDYERLGKDPVGMMYAVFLNIRKPMKKDANYSDWDKIRYSGNKISAWDLGMITKYHKRNYDGAIIENVADPTEYATDYIVWESTQIKSATDNVGTFDSTQPNILYQTKNKEMLTIHNISEDNLQQVIKQGGLPMPSLAVINTKETKHDEFGEISLIADPSIMDVSRKNPVYSQDAWTPTYPTVYSRVDESSRADAQWIADRINKRYNAKIKVYEIMNDAQRQNSTGTIEEIVARKVSEAAAKNYNAKHEVLTPAQEYYDDALKYVRHLLRIRPLKIREEIRGLNDRYGNARYRPNTAEEAVKVMRYEKNRTDKPIWESREMIGKIAPKFSSMTAVDKNRWRLMSKEARIDAVHEINADLRKIVGYSKEKRVEYRGYAATTDVVNDIYDIAKGDMKYVRQRYAPDTDFSAFHEIIKKIKKIPTDMFESKPDRVVKLSEFAAAIVPYGTDYKTLKALKDAGINIAFYERGDMDDRHDKVVHEAEKSAILFQAQKSAPEGTVSVKTAAQRRAEAQETVIRSAAMLKSKLNKTNNVHEMTELMQKAVGTWIRLMYPGAAPLDGLEEYIMVADLSELDPDTKEYQALARKLARKRAADKKFRNAMLDNTGFSDTGDIPFENLYASLSAINPAAFDRVVKDESMDMLIDLIPGIKEAFGLKEGESIDLKLLQKIYDATFTSSPEVGDSKAVRPFRLPHRRLISAFGKAGQKLVDLGYKGTLKMAEYELLYSPKLRELHELIRSNQNNRGKKYDGDALKAISEAMMVINSKQDIADDQKLDAIKKSLKEWSEKNNEVINEKDIEGIYNVTRDILDMFRDFIVKFNQDPNHKKIGIREDYGDPRRYDWLRAAQTSIEGGVLLHAPGHVKQRTKDELSANYDSFSRDIYGNYLGYVQLMSKYMAFYDFAEYLKDRKMRYIKGGKAQEIDLGSPMARDMTKAQIAAFEDSNMREYIHDYAQGVIGIQRSGKKWDKRISAWVNNVYSSALVFNVGLTLKNFNQRMLILSVVDPHVAGQVMKDYSFWKGLFKRDHEKYPTLSQIMQTYRDVNDSLIADLVSESKRMSDGETNPTSKLYYDWTALNGNLLRLSPFSVAELGNRAYGHAAGVYQIIMNSPDYKEARAKGMEVHEAMEHALSNNNALREAAITYGGIINAEINADANPAFAPMFFNGASGINKIATFVRYGITLANLELRTFGSSSSMKSMLSPDMFKLWTSGEIKAASLSTKLQSAQIFYRALTDSNIAKLVEKSRMSSKDESDMLTTKQVKMVRELIGEQIEIVEKAIKGDYRHIVRGSKGKLIAELGLIGFAVAEAIIGFLHNIIVAMLPWWQKDSPLDDGIQIGLNDVLELSQTTSMFTDFRLGAGITPNLNAYYGSDKTTIKDAARWINRGTPFMGHVNQAIREATGKYGTDYIVDEIFDIME